MEAEGFTIRKLEEGIQYWFKVQAIYEEFSGPWSEKAEGTTGQPEPPTDFKIIKQPTKDGKRSLELRWKKNEVNEDLEIRYSYKVKCNETGGVAKEKEASQEEVSMKMNELALKAGKEYICELYIETDKGVRSTVERRSTTAKAIEVPAFSQTSVPWGTDITFGMLEGHKYRLKDSKGGVVSLDTSSDPAKVSATESVSAVVIEVTHTEYEGKEESAEIAFTRQAGDRFKFESASHDFMFNTNENKYTHVITETDPEDTPVRYSINPSSSGARIDGSSGEVSIEAAAVGNTFTITATKAADDKYAEEREEYELRVKASTNTGDIVKPTFRPSKSEPWGTDISFEKLEGYTYELKDDKGGAVSLDTSSNPARISATESVSAVVIEVRRAGYSGKVEGDPIEFTKQTRPATKPIFSKTSVPWGTAITFTPAPLHRYKLKNRHTGVTLGNGKITANQFAENIIVQAILPGDSKYEEAVIDSVPIEFTKQTRPATKPIFSRTSVSWGTAITFTPAPLHRYKLKNRHTGVTLGNGKITANQFAENVIVQAILPEDSKYEEAVIDSVPITFTRQTGDTLFFTKTGPFMLTVNVPKFGKVRNAFGRARLQKVRVSRDIPGDKRRIIYTASSSRIDMDRLIIFRGSKTETITAKKEQNEKYTESTASYKITVKLHEYHCSATGTHRDGNWKKGLCYRIRKYN